MSDKKYQIFISSTYKDLVSAREMVLKQILSLHQFPIGMEMFSADDDEQWDVIKRTIDQSDYYVLIVGHRYGSETKEEISYTEKEFDYAKSIGVPILSFIRNRAVATTPDQREDDLPEKKTKLERFITKATSNKMCDFWMNDEDLARKVIIALGKAFHSKPRIGWVRSDQAVSPKVSEELARLSSENRELTVELETYRSKLQNRKPKFEIMFQPTDSEGFDFKEILFKPKTFPKITRIPSNLRPFISDEDIDLYNDSLPHKDAVDKYNGDLKNYSRLVNGGTAFKILVKNVGNSSGSELNIDIKVPEGVIVVKKYVLEELSEPTIELPENPLEKAELAYKKSQPRSFVFRHGVDLEPTSPLKDIPYDMDFPLPSSIHEKAWIDINDSKIAIEIKKIIHTREEVFGDLVFVPLYAGKFIFVATAICEEMEAPEHIQIEVLVS